MTDMLTSVSLRNKMLRSMSIQNNCCLISSAYLRFLFQIILQCDTRSKKNHTHLVYAVILSNGFVRRRLKIPTAHPVKTLLFMLIFSRLLFLFEDFNLLVVCGRKMKALA